MLPKILALVLLTSVLAAQRCPDTTTRTVPTDITVGPLVDCSSLEVKIDGVQFGTQVTGCPTVIVVTPPHLEPISQPGCDSRAVPDGQVQITKIFFECETTYLLFIKLSSSCTLKSRMNAGAIATYKAIPCDESIGGLNSD